jgi:dimethylamine corrinoid protein
MPLLWFGPPRNTLEVPVDLAGRDRGARAGTDRGGTEVKGKDLLLALEEAVFNRDSASLESLLAGFDGSDVGPSEAIRALAKGMDRVRGRLRDREISIPEFLLSIDVFRQGLRRIARDACEEEPGEDRETRTVVIGVVEGDTHDMGKNIVAAVLEASGYRVVDVGRDVPRDVFLSALKETKASILALSTMMSTPLENMREVIQWTRRLYPDVKILVGGAPLDERIAAALGADGYAESAVTAPEEASRLVGKTRRAAKAAPVPKAG